MTTLDELYTELEQVERMTEAEVMAAYNADCKEEIIELIREDIESLTQDPYGRYSNDHRAQDDYTDDELEQERLDLCLSQGLTRYC